MAGCTGGSGWEWDENTQQYYHHAFLKEQPDLNWRNPQLQQAILEMMRFWLDKGIDGFRVDVMWHLIKDKYWRNNPPNPNFKEGMPTYDKFLPLYSTDHPEVHTVVAMLRKVVDQYKEKVLIGEMYLPVENVVDYYGQDGSGAHLPGNFQLLLLDWNARKIALEIDKYESSLPEGAWPNWVLSNHDRPRLSTRIGKEQILIAAMLLLTLRGTPTLYYGDEIGMSNVEIPMEEVQDPQGKLMPELGLSRDPQRTPMQWNKEDNAGFTSGKPWLRIAHDFKQVNVETLKENKESILHFYRKLIALRKKEPALHEGRYAPVLAEGDILAYLHQTDSVQFLIVLNLGGQTADFIPAGIPMKGKVVISTHPEREGMKLTGNPIKLKSNEGVIIQLS
ncbi:alpha-amylase family glycosyl hydrolase [Rhodocytophaga rosea]|uniref:alpha-amylase family glycosyl hydrolase n=1 Tax=Rhodocytophaga rosea TaxID=2704465 RepID=UPI0021D382BF|nr:alpha-amylase family glycosyl hydrolase [Rhodocytophaga rosea]